MYDFTKCKLNCNLSPCKEAVPDWCDGSCSSCERVRQCPCCNKKIRDQLLQGNMGVIWRREDANEPQAVNIEISQISYPAPWQQRSISNELVRQLAKDLRHRGQLHPIKIRPRARTNGKSQYQIVNGDRRLRSARYNEWSTLKAVVKPMDDCEASAAYLLDNLAERIMPWEEVALSILAVGMALTRKTGHPCDSRQLGRLLGRSKDWINDHKRALRVIRAHEIPKGTIPHYKLLRPLGHGIPFSVEESILQGIINDKWTLERVYEEIRKRCSRVDPSPVGSQVGETSSERDLAVERTPCVIT